MHAVEGGVTSGFKDRLARSRRGTSDQEVYRALVTTLGLLARRLDVLLQEPLPEAERLAATRTRALAGEVVDALRELTSATDRRRPRAAAAFSRLADDFSRATGTCVQVRVKGTLDDVPDDVVAVLFGVACEAFLHIERHGRATVVLLSVDVDDRRVVLDLRDDGLDLGHREAYDSGAETRLGILTASKLVRSVGGRVAVTAVTPRGLRLMAVVPRA